MRKMSDVFELPVSDVELEIYGCFYREGVQMADGERAAAHAINHVDALADALENLIDEYECFMPTRAADRAAVTALAAYRSEK